MHVLIRRFGRYLFTGGAAAVVDAGGFYLLATAGMALTPAAIASFVVAACVNYLLTSRFVFGQAASRAGFARFFTSALIGLAINVTITLLLVARTPLPPVICKLLAIAVAMFVNFALLSLAVFRTPAADTAPRR